MFFAEKCSFPKMLGGWSCKFICRFCKKLYICNENKP